MQIDSSSTGGIELTTGQIAGIVVGMVILAFLIGGFVFVVRQPKTVETA